VRRDRQQLALTYHGSAPGLGPQGRGAGTRRGGRRGEGEKEVGAGWGPPWQTVGGPPLTSHALVASAHWLGVVAHPACLSLVAFTGDNPLTAVNVSRNCGLIPPDAPVFLGDVVDGHPERAPTTPAACHSRLHPARMID